MLRFLGTVLLLFWVSFPVGAGLAADPSQAAPVPAVAAVPVVEVPEASFDFGEMSEDGDYVHDFKLRNTGAVTLEIKKVLPG